MHDSKEMKAEQPANFIGTRRRRWRRRLEKRKKERRTVRKLAGGRRKAAGPVRGPWRSRRVVVRAQADTRRARIERKTWPARWRDTMSGVLFIAFK